MTAIKVALVLRVPIEISSTLMNSVKIDFRADPSPEEKAFVFNNLAEFNVSQVGEARFKEFAGFLPRESLNRFWAAC